MFGKNHKYWKRKKTDALHPSKIQPHLPAGEALYNQVKEAETFFNTASRVGGGGITAGSVGLRFVDRKSSTRLHELYTEPNKIKKIEKPTEHNINEFIGDKAPEGPPINVVSVPTNYCPGCDSVAPIGGFRTYFYRDKRTGLQSSQKATLNVAPVMEPWPECKLAPGDVLRHIICGRCTVEMRYGSGSRLKIVIQTPTGPEEMPVGIYEYAQFNMRVNKNLETFIRQSWTLRREDTFFDPRGEDIVKQR